MVERLQAEPGERTLLPWLKAGSAGLKRTAANQVVHFDLWWNPAVQAQATDHASGNCPSGARIGGFPTPQPGRFP